MIKALFGRISLLTNDVERDNARKEQSKTASSDLEVGCVCGEGIKEKFLHNRNLNRAADHCGSSTYS